MHSTCRYNWGILYIIRSSVERAATWSAIIDVVDKSSESCLLAELSSFFIDRSSGSSW